MHKASVALAAFAIGFCLAAPSGWSAELPPGRSAETARAQVVRPKVADRLSKERMKKVVSGEVETRCALGPKSPDGSREFVWDVALRVPTSPVLAEEGLTDFSIYAKSIPFVQKSEWNPQTQIMDLEGGIWGWNLKSFIEFKRVESGWQHFKVVMGHFYGMEGDLLLERQGERNTLVYLSGQIRGQGFPPTWVMERGGEVVLSVTARKLRAQLIGRKEAPAHDSKIPEDPKLPKPKRTL